MFGLFKKKKTYTLLKPDMIQPVDAEISTVDAKKIYRMHMQSIEFYDREDLSEAVRSFAEEINEEEEIHKDSVQFQKDEINSLQSELKALRVKLAACQNSEESKDLQEEIEGIEEDIENSKKELESEKKELAKFKSDKRLFLVKYINDEIRAVAERE